MSASILVSIVIPAHNEERWISLCIESLLRQTYKNIEIIVVDDGSKDRTFEIASRYPVRIIRHERCMGEATARTTGTKAAKGEIVLHGECDAIYPPDYIEKGLKYFKDPEVGAISCGQIKVLSFHNTLITEYCRVKRFASFQMRAKGEKPTYGCHMVRREIFEKIGYYDPSCIMGSDADLALRIQAAGIKVAWASDMYFYHADPSSLWAFVRRTFKGNLYNRCFLERWGKWPRGWKMVAFWLWNILVTMMPLYLALSLLHWVFAIVTLAIIGAESVGPFLILKEFRIAMIQALKERRFLLVLCMPFITFLRVRAAFYGRIGAILFSKKIQKAVTYD